MIVANVRINYMFHCPSATVWVWVGERRYSSVSSEIMSLIGHTATLPTVAGRHPSSLDHPEGLFTAHELN